MKNYTEKEQKLAKKIFITLENLDNTLIKMEVSENKVSYFIEQEKAIHEIKQIIRNENKIEILEEEKISDEVSIASNIYHQILKLENSLEVLEDEPNKVQSYIEQRKCIREINKIIDDVEQEDDLIWS